MEEPKCIQPAGKEGSGHRGGGGAAVSTDVLNRITKLEDEKTALKKTVSTMEQTILDLTKRLAALETSNKTTSAAPPKKAEPVEEDDDDDDEVDLFGSDDEEEDAEAARVREERLAAYAEKKSKKPGPIAKSSILLDVKPWDDETDMDELTKNVRTIVMEGLVWGASELKPVGFGIKKLSILTTVVDDLVCVEDLTDKIEAFEDFVQSVDIAAFNKV